MRRLASAAHRQASETGRGTGVTRSPAHTWTRVAPSAAWRQSRRGPTPSARRARAKVAPWPRNDPGRRLRRARQGPLRADSWSSPPEGSPRGPACRVRRQPGAAVVPGHRPRGARGGRRLGLGPRGPFPGLGPPGYRPEAPRAPDVAPRWRLKRQALGPAGSRSAQDCGGPFPRPRLPLGLRPPRAVACAMP